MNNIICNVFFTFFLMSFCFGQEKTIFINIPFDNDKMFSFDGQIRVFKIKTNNDGIIISVESTNKPNYISTEVTIDREKIIIKSKNRILAINEILIKNEEIWVRGGPRSIYTKDIENYLHITICDSPDILYEHEELKLTKSSEKSLAEVYKIIPSKYFSIIYCNNFSKIDYRFSGNTNRKYEYSNIGSKYFVTYYYGDDKIIPDIEIYGDSLYSHDVRKNVINYFVLQSADIFLAELLFPSIFLKNPFNFSNEQSPEVSTN